MEWFDSTLLNKVRNAINNWRWRLYIAYTYQICKWTNDEESPINSILFCSNIVYVFSALSIIETTNFIIDKQNVYKTMEKKQIIYRVSNLRKMHWKLVLAVLEHLFYPKIEHTIMYIFS